MFNLFVYGTLRRGHAAAVMLDDCEHLGTATVRGILYDIEGRFPALVLYGTDPVEGEIWRCPPELLERLDAYEGIANGLFRRVGVEAEMNGAPVACWTYAAGPAIARKLLPERRLTGMSWPGR
jgi:gamma-glutamylcyclotransferase (GGCT)/AIG2-like uncharacterized protein YtfP